ncbi:MAG: hypothetical protein II685_00035 [Clostridia bacterium]|nr:hypothetical protein [Clostridia bacterium]
MLEIIDQMIAAVNNSSENYTAKRAFEEQAVNCPINKTTAYFVVSEVREKEAQVVVWVCSSAESGAYGSVSAACAIYNILFEGGFEILSGKVGETEFNEKSDGFVTKITLTVADGSLDFNEAEAVKYNLNMQLSSTEIVWFVADSAEFTMANEAFGINSFFEDEPVGYRKFVNKRKLKLGGVLKQEIERMADHPFFGLYIHKTNENFSKCFCESMKMDLQGDKGDCVIALGDRVDNSE